MIQQCLRNPHGICQYITLTRKDAEEIIWADCLKFLDDQKIEYKANNTKLSITFKNNSQIRLSGCSDKSEVSNFRGKKYILVIIDEAQRFPPFIRELINDSIEPALRDLNGELILIGTPNPLQHGVFYEAYHGIKELKGFEPFHWTMNDNPYLEIQSGISNEQYIQNLLKERGWDRDHPTFRREWLGEWVLDSDSLVYKASEERNVYQTVPHRTEDLDYFFGVDYGMRDSDAIAVLAHNNYDRNIYLIDEYKCSGSSISPMVEKLQEFYSKYSPIAIVADTGGLGLKITEEITQRYGLPIYAASKSEKLGNIEMFNADILAGYFKCKADSMWLHEAKNLTWDLTKQKPQEASGADNHLCDAVLYAWREMRKYKTDETMPEMTEEEKIKQILYGNKKNEFERQDTVPRY